jgi:hypothetical protein
MTGIDQLQRIKKYAVVAHFKALFQKLPGEVEQIYEEPHIQGQILCFSRNWNTFESYWGYTVSLWLDIVQPLTSFSSGHRKFWSRDCTITIFLVQ